MTIYFPPFTISSLCSQLIFFFFSNLHPQSLLSIREKGGISEDEDFNLIHEICLASSDRIETVELSHWTMKDSSFDNVRPHVYISKLSKSLTILSLSNPTDSDGAPEIYPVFYTSYIRTKVRSKAI